MVKIKLKKQTANNTDNYKSKVEGSKGTCSALSGNSFSSSTNKK
jgi:hypothetical protein